MASQSVTCDASEPTETVLLPAQGKITIGWNTDGDMILRQTDWPNEDAVIIIGRDYIDMFIDRLTDAMGIPITKERFTIKSIRRGGQRLHNWHFQRSRGVPWSVGEEKMVGENG
jgi:hypothetical protein